MKTLSKIFIVLVLLGISGLMKPQQVPAQGVGVSFQLFYDQLSPYGQWVEYPGYSYVWIPDAGPEFSPYATEGHWVLTYYGWTWVSDYPWGWAPFHYGRWFFDDYYGWMWVPGREWGPAWVQWRRCEGYYGWAPISPGISIEATFGRAYHIRGEHWRFVRDRDFDRPDMDHYYINHRENSRFIQNSTVITNRSMDNRGHAYYIAGPERNEVQKYTGKAVREVPIKENTLPGQTMKDNQLLIYKPIVQKTKGNSPSPMPSKAVPIKEAKPWSQRNTQNPTQVKNPSDNNMGKPQPIQQKDANPTKKQEQEKQPRPITPSDKNMGKAQPIQQKSGNPSVKPQQQKRPQGATPVNTKKAVQQKKEENPPKK